MSRRTKIAAILLAGTLCFTTVPAQALADDSASTATSQEKIQNTYKYMQYDVFDGSWLRLGGENRYQTMAKVVQKTFETSDYAIIATGNTFADALCANGLAGTLKCPVILTAPNKLSTEAKDELSRLGVKNVYIVGNTTAVTSGVEESLEQLSYNVVRLAGGSDQETSIKVMQECRKAGSPSENVIIVTGTTFPDALSIGPWAYASGSPILYTDASGMLSDAQVQALKADGKIKHAIVVGGATAVSDKVADQLGKDIEGWRIGGTDRYDTSAKVADWCLNHGGLTYKTPVLTTGKNFPDALCGAALAAKGNSVLVIADKFTDVTIERLRKNSDRVAGGYVLGEKSAISIDSPFVDPAQQAQAEEVTDAIGNASTGGSAEDDVSYDSDDSSSYRPTEIVTVDVDEVMGYLQEEVGSFR